MEKEHIYCLRCGRKLKSPEARQLGYGPICIKRLSEKKDKKALFKVEKYVD